MFNLAIDNKVRGCDVVAMRVDDVAPDRYAINRAKVHQRKTRRSVRFELTEQTRQALDDQAAPRHYAANKRFGPCRGHIVPA
jgi:integrase